MKISSVGRACADGVEQRVEKADGRFANSSCLLVDQSCKAGPKWGGGTRTTQIQLNAVAIDIDIISRERNIWCIALCCGTLIGGHADVRLPTGDAILSAD